MNETQVQTGKHVKSIKKEIKDCRPQHHLGQDLDKLAAQFRAGALELQSARQRKRNLTLLTLKARHVAGGNDLLEELTTKTCDELLATGHADKTQADTRMVKEKLNAARTSAQLLPRPVASSSTVESGHLPTTCLTPVVEIKTWCGAQAKALAMIQEASNGTADKVIWMHAEAAR